MAVGEVKEPAAGEETGGDAFTGFVRTIADGGVFKGSPAILGGADALLPVDLIIAGCPPTPGQIVDGLLALLEAHEVKKEVKARGSAP